MTFINKIASNYNNDVSFEIATVSRLSQDPRMSQCSITTVIKEYGDQAAGTTTGFLGHNHGNHGV